MGDGSYHSGLILSTDSFSIPDIVKLMNVLIIRYRVECTIHKYSGRPRIYIPSRFKNTIRSLVFPYMHPSMLYKLGL